MLHLHSLLRWVVLILALLAIIKGLSGLSGKKTFTPGDRKTVLFFMISMDIQLLIGLVLYFTSAFGLKNIRNQGMGAIMKDSASRFFAIEHGIGMIVAIILAHMAYNAAKKNIPDAKKFKKVFWCSLLSLVVMMATIPWPFREAIARPLFPGM